MVVKVKTSLLRRREFWSKSLPAIGYLYVSNNNDDGVLPPSEHRCKRILDRNVIQWNRKSNKQL